MRCDISNVLKISLSMKNKLLKHGLNHALTIGVYFSVLKANYSAATSEPAHTFVTVL